MRKDLYNLLKALEVLELKSIEDVLKVKEKCRLFKRKFEHDNESIENRVKIIILDNILRSLDQEKFVFNQASKCKPKYIRKMKVKPKVIFQIPKSQISTPKVEKPISENNSLLLLSEYSDD